MIKYASNSICVTIETKTLSKTWITYKATLSGLDQAYTFFYLFEHPIVSFRSTFPNWWVRFTTLLFFKPMQQCHCSFYCSPEKYTQYQDCKSFEMLFVLCDCELQVFTIWLACSLILHSFMLAVVEKCSQQCLFPLYVIHTNG